jgi:lipopolysaccharide export system ATP-binding protein
MNKDISTGTEINKVIKPAEAGAEVRKVIKPPEAGAEVRKVIKPAEAGAEVRKVIKPVEAGTEVRKVIKPAETGTEVRKVIKTPETKTEIRKAIKTTEEENRKIQKKDVHTLGIKGLHKKFGKKEVVRGVDFIMQNGEVAGLLGPNGAGKTTIFYMIVGFYTPNQGVVVMNDINITPMPMYRRARMGIAYLPQEASIFRKLTVEQNIWAILESRKDINKKQKLEKLESLLDEFHIGRIRSQFGYTLSGGERRRTEIARALATEPKFLLLDEPFAGIDPIAVFDIKQIIRQLADKGIGILITDHNVRDTLEITNEAFIIADGLIFAHGGREDILNNEMVRKLYLGSEFRM